MGKRAKKTRVYKSWEPVEELDNDSKLKKHGFDHCYAFRALPTKRLPKNCKSGLRHQSISDIMASVINYTEAIMKYDLTNPPVLEDETSVMADIPGIGLVGCVVVGIATNAGPYPMYIVRCTDGTFPNDTYKYPTFVFPLSQLYLS